MFELGSGWTWLSSGSPALRVRFRPHRTAGPELYNHGQVHIALKWPWCNPTRTARAVRSLELHFFKRLVDLDDIDQISHAGPTAQGRGIL